jgi:hypothetical protein
MAGLCVYFGFFTSFNVEGAAEAASFLLRGRQ